MNYDRARRMCTLQLNASRIRSWHQLIGILCMALTTAAQAADSPPPQEPSIQIKWLTIFDHRTLVTWPPTLEENRLNDAVRTKLQTHLKLARNDIQYLGINDESAKVQALQNRVQQGESAYEALNHRKAAAHLSQALDGFYALGWHLHNPTNVAKVQLLLGKTRLEQGKEGEAERLFRLAMSLNPRLKIQEEFEHPNTVRVLKQARRSFLTRAPELPKASARSNQNEVVVEIHGRLVNDRIELLINASSGTRLEIEQVNEDLDRAISRLSTRILDCLPLAETFSKSSAPPSVIASLGMGVSSYARSPVGTFLFYDTVMDFQYKLSRNLEWWTNLRLSNSGPDSSEHIRNTITSLSLSFAPRPRFHFGRVTLSVYAAPWIERRGKYESTTNPACKFFTPESAPPIRLCNFEREVKSYPADWVAGIAIGTELQVKLARKLYLLWATSARSKILEDVSTSMQYLVGSHVSLGYQF